CVIVEPAGMNRRSNATTARRSIPWLVRPAYIVGPSALLSDPSGSWYRVLSFDGKNINWSARAPAADPITTRIIARADTTKRTDTGAIPISDPPQAQDARRIDIRFRLSTTSDP